VFNKNNVCAIMQPTYLPWLGYFDLIANSKDFIFLDDVKFNKSSYHHNNKILGTNGVISLSVPTFANNGRMETMINEVKVDDTKKWRKNHLSSIKQSYSKKGYFDEIYPYIENIINSNITNLSTLNIELIKFFTSILEFDTNFHIASRMGSSKNDIDKVLRLINFCMKQNCNSYYSPLGSLDYLDTLENKKLFQSAGITIYFQNFRVSSYPQKNQDFVPYMSILDALMNCGPKNTRGIIRKNSRVEKLK
jgi:hypothetical protein